MRYDFSEQDLINLQKIFDLAGKQGGLPWYGIIADLHKKLTRPFIEADQTALPTGLGEDMVHDPHMAEK